jgi:hypothetical protein
MRQCTESQCAKCKGADRQGAEFREKVKAPTCQGVDTIKCLTLNISIDYIMSLT